LAAIGLLGERDEGTMLPVRNAKSLALVGHVPHLMLLRCGTEFDRSTNPVQFQ